MKTRDLTKIALLVAMNCVSSYVIIPLPFSLSPLSLQTLMVNIVALLLPLKQAALVMVVYLFLGLVGVPVFTGGTAGVAKIFGPTGGYLLGFLPAVILMAYLKGSKDDFLRNVFVTVGVGIPIIYTTGVTQLMIVTGLGFREAFVMGALPFIVGDIVKAVAAAWLIKRIREF